MGILGWLNRNRPSENKPKWEDTEEGKDFIEKYRASMEKRKLLKEEWERTTPPEKKEQVKLFKIIFTPFFLVYIGFLFWGFFKAKNELWVLLAEGCIALVSLILFFVKPKFIKYPNCFMMPVIAFGSTVLFYVYLGLGYGFNPNRRDSLLIDYNKIEKTEIEMQLDDEGELSKSDFENREYTKFLSESKIESEAELEKDFENYRRLYD